MTHFKVLDQFLIFDDGDMSHFKVLNEFLICIFRETEYLFSTVEGRNQLAKTAKYNRLIVVTLHPDHTYGGMDEVKAELSAKVMELAPPGLGNFQVK